MIPMASRVRKARRGLDRAVKEGKVFHLWFHPFNLCTDRPGMTAALREILSSAANLRDRGLLKIMTMEGLADWMMESKDSAANPVCEVAECSNRALERPVGTSY